MNIFHSINDFVGSKKTIFTLGTFDGVHLGHQKILEQLTKSTQNGIYESVVLTFFTPPRAILEEQLELKLLNTLDEKTLLLQKYGVQNLVIHHFDEEFSKLSAQEFVHKILVNRFNIHKIIIGYDHRFGNNRMAGIEDLLIFGKHLGFEVEQISPQEIRKNIVSSTQIRDSLAEGNIALANGYLGYNYSITGTVVRGRQLGQTIGFPTANLSLDNPQKLIPKNGVYIVNCQFENSIVFGMMNIGTNPTVGGKEQKIEIHFLDFDQDLYDKKLTISILQRIRSEEKFDSILLLKNQIEKDKNKAEEYIKTEIF